MKIRSVLAQPQIMFSHIVQIYYASLVLSWLSNIALLISTALSPDHPGTVLVYVTIAMVLLGLPPLAKFADNIGFNWHHLLQCFFLLFYIITFVLIGFSCPDSSIDFYGDIVGPCPVSPLSPEYPLPQKLKAAPKISAILILFNLALFAALVTTFLIIVFVYRHRGRPIWTQSLRSLVMAQRVPQRRLLDPRAYGDGSDGIMGVQEVDKCDGHDP